MVDYKGGEKIKRTRFEVRADILKTAKNGARKTQLVYGSCTNFKLIKSYIIYLIDNGLLIQDGKYYHTTKKGLSYIRKVKSIN